jgi:acid phosphatase family membrane protein YuiD
VKRLYGSGGMPSSHSATVTGLACAIGLREGVGGPLFAISFVLACIVSILIFDLYDTSS